MNIGTFIGSWKIQYKSEDAGGPVQNGWILLIGTDTDNKGYGDIPPYLDGENTVCVGFALIDPTNTTSPVVISTKQHEGNQPAVLALVGEHLQWTGYYDQQPARIYISAAQTATATGGVVYLYGSTTYGDPEQVAVWGGSGTPPPQNP
ncbi:MAG TPA: hypothetical protein VIJ36_21600 [Thermoanaerobaculia bacterium]|jgi:hypothetical protein